MKPRRLNKQNAIEFALRLEENEASMPEGAAFAVTCEEFGWDDDDGHMAMSSLAGLEQPWWAHDKRLSAEQQADERTAYRDRNSNT